MFFKPKALTQLEEAAEPGDPEAQLAIAGLYVTGQGEKQDLYEGAKWCRRAAEQGFWDAQFGRGIMYQEGMGVVQD